MYEECKKPKGESYLYKGMVSSIYRDRIERPEAKSLVEDRGVRSTISGDGQLLSRTREVV